jgi:GT2 family glycosyltransferase
MAESPLPQMLPIDVVVTTYGTDTLYTQACLEAIGRWKRPHHRLIVVTHDESVLLRTYLEALRTGPGAVVDDLILAVPRHGHTRGYNLAVRRSHADVVFHIANDLCVGPALVDACAARLRVEPQLGLIGWNFHHEGVRWDGERIADYTLKDPASPALSTEHRAAIESAPWFTGALFRAIGPLAICMCNTAFFGMRREVLARLGGGFGRQYRHYWADDLLCYAVLDQGLDISHFDKRFRKNVYFYPFQHVNQDVPDRRRHADELNLDRVPALLHARSISDGLTLGELCVIYLAARALPPQATVYVFGPERGAAVIAALEGRRGMPTRLVIVNDASRAAGNREALASRVAPFIEPTHDVVVLPADLPPARVGPVDLVVMDGAWEFDRLRKTVGAVRAGLAPRGVALFHDYGDPAKSMMGAAVHEALGPLPMARKLAVFRAAPDVREKYEWDE